MKRSIAAALMMLAIVGCGGSVPSDTPVPSGSATPIPTSPGPRPASPAVLTIVSPTDGQVITGTTVHVVLGLTGATIVAATTTSIRPDQGHVHLYVDGNLVSMNYQLTQDLPVTTGTYVLKAEFVAADHAPFNPRVWSDQVVFTVK